VAILKATKKIVQTVTTTKGGIVGLIDHAERELKAAGLFDKDSDYSGMLGNSTMKLIRVFAEEGHSGMSASIQIDLFKRLANFENLTPLTDSQYEWVEITNNLWQNNRNGTCFSTDRGKSYYSVDDSERKIKESKKTNV
jgi:hypothetical protein